MKTVPSEWKSFTRQPILFYSINSTTSSKKGKDKWAGVLEMQVWREKKSTKLL